MRSTKLMHSSRKNLLLSSAVALAAFAAVQTDTYAQGCVAVRGTSCNLLSHEAEHLHPGDWLATLSYRWLHSDHHFAGNEDRGPARYAAGNEVINDSHFFDLSVQYAISDRVSAAMVLPFVYSDRSSLYEHDGVNRHHTQAAGIADMRVGLYGWLLNPADMPKGNVSFGLGLKLPTGDDNATDDFVAPGGGTVELPVDQSIQPGDGGWGATTEVFAFRQILPRTMAYFQGSYLFNPQNVNDTSTRNARGPRGFTLEALQTRPQNAALWARAQALGYTSNEDFEDVMSITDQYLMRTGVGYTIWPKMGLMLTLGGRLEGIPVEDVFGSSDGFRRPGYTISIEPGIALTKGKFTINVLAPVALERVREKSVADQRWSELTGRDENGDAAFADYVITTSISYRF